MKKNNSLYIQPKKQKNVRNREGGREEKKIASLHLKQAEEAIEQQEAISVPFPREGKGVRENRL